MAVTIFNVIGFLVVLSVLTLPFGLAQTTVTLTSPAFSSHWAINAPLLMLVAPANVGFDIGTRASIGFGAALLIGLLIVVFSNRSLGLHFLVSAFVGTGVMFMVLMVYPHPPLVTETATGGSPPTVGATVNLVRLTSVQALMTVAAFVFGFLFYPPPKA